MSGIGPQNKPIPLFKLDYIFGGISVLIIAWFYTVFCLYVSNLPLTDDVYDIFYYTIANQEDIGFIDKLKLLLWQYDDHKLVFNHLVHLTSFAIFKKINLVFITSIGAIALIALLFCTFHLFDKKQKTPFVFMILTALIFNFSHNELTFWAMAILNAYVIPLMAVVCFYLLTLKKYRYIFIASALMLLSIVSMPNGVLIFLLGIPLIIIAQEKKVAALFLGLWLLSGLVALFTFSSGMAEFQSFSQMEPKQLLTLYRQLSLITLGMLALLGGLPFIVGDNVLYAIILGFINLVFLGFLFLFRDKLSLKPSPPLIFFWLFCLMSLGLCAVFRVPLNGIEYGALVSRYKILTCFVWAIPLCLLASSYAGNTGKRLHQFFIFMIAFTILITCNYRGMKQVDYWSNTKKRDYSNWVVRGDQSSMGISSWYNFTHEIFSEAIRLNLYTPFTSRGIDFQPEFFEKLDTCIHPAGNASPLHSGANHDEKAMGAKIAFIDKDDVIAYVVFCSPQGNYLAKLDNNSWVDISSHKKKLVMDSRWLAPGDYEIIFLDSDKKPLKKGTPSLQIKHWRPEYNCNESQMNYLPARKIMMRTICQPGRNTIIKM